MHNDADQGVEEDGKVIFVARLIGEWKTSWVFMAGFLASDIMVQGDEDIGQRTCWLQINKIVVLNIKLSLLEGSRCYVAFPLNGNVSQIREPEKPKIRNTQEKQTHLNGKSNDEYHRHGSNNIGMILDYKFLT